MATILEEEGEEKAGAVGAGMAILEEAGTAILEGAEAEVAVVEEAVVEGAACWRGVVPARPRLSPYFSLMHKMELETS